MTIYRKAAGSWTTIRNMYRKSGGVWTSIENVYRKAGGVWNSVFLRNNSPIISSRVTIASDVSYIGDGQFATLTGRNYSWTPTSGLTLTYRFEKSTAIDFASVTLISSGNISNPASGSSNTITQAVYPAAFSQTDMYFRFKVTAVNSSGTTVSVSDIIGISYYGTPVPQSPYPQISGSTTVGRNAFGDIGVWTNSPTSYSYRWFFNAGLSSYPLTFSQSRSVSNKSLSGFTATLTTSAPHGYKASDTVIVTSMDSLFNKSSATILSTTTSTITYTINTPTAWVDAGTGYSSGTFVSYAGNAYAASTTISSVSPYNGGTLYSSGAIVYSGNNRYQSNLNNNIGNSVTNPIYWNPLGSYAPDGPQWTLQSFSNTATSGTTTAPNYYEGTTTSASSILLTTPTTDYRTSIDLRGNVLGFGVKAYNPATSNPSEYIGTKFVYGVPVITIGTIVAGSTTASIPYTQSYMTEYDIDIKYAGTSISTYPKNVTSPSTPISIVGLTAPRDYTYSITPKNGEGTAGTIKTGTFSTIIEQWTVTWDPLGGNGGGTTTQNRGLAHTAPSPGTRDGFDFVYYRYPASGGTDPVFVASGGTYTPTANVTFGAIWTAKTYTVSYNANGGTGAPANQTKTHNVALTLSSTTPTRATVGSTSYTFNGWNTAADGSGTNYSAGGSYTLNAPLTLYAKWTATTLTWTITWNANGGTGGGTTTQNQGVSHTAPSPGTRDGFDFFYWRYPAIGDIVSTVSDGGTFNPTANITFAASWSAKTYTVSYNANGGTGAPANQTKTHNVTLTLSSTTPTRATVGSTSYTFNGWNTAADGSGTNYSAGGSYTANAAVTLYAKWLTGTVNQPVVWPTTITAPTFSRGSSSLRWGWNDQLPTSGTYTASDIKWEFQFSSTASTAGLLASGTKPRRIGGGLTVGSATFDNRVSSQSSDYSTSYPAVLGEPVTYSASARYLRYRGSVVGANGTTYVSSYSAWV